MKNISTIIVILFAVAVLAVGAWFFVATKSLRTGSNTQTPANSSGSTVPGSNPQNVVPVNTQGSSSNNLDVVFTLVTNDGGAIEAADPKKDPVAKENAANKGYYYYQQSTSTSTEVTPFTILYIEKTQFFNIVLNEEPIGQVRKQAQQYLAQRLNLTEAQLCRLNYMVSVPYKVNEFYASMNLGFEGCPGAEVF